jgi:hypothetical protein
VIDERYRTDCERTVDASRDRSFQRRPREGLEPEEKKNWTQRKDKNFTSASIPKRGEYRDVLTPEQMNHITGPDYRGPPSLHATASRTLFHSPAVDFFDVVTPADTYSEGWQLLVLGQPVNRRGMDAQIDGDLFYCQHVDSSHHE